MGAALRTARSRLVALPGIFTYSQARKSAHLTDRHLALLREEGLIDAIGKGLYRRVDGADSEDHSAADTDLLEVAHRAADATLCLTTAMVRHDLTDAIPAAIDVALPRGRHRPSVSVPVLWHSFDTATFSIGREQLRIGASSSIGIYSAERCIIDAFRLSHLEGEDLAVEALRRWLRRRGNNPSSLLEMAQDFPKAQRSLRYATMILL